MVSNTEDFSHERISTKEVSQCAEPKFQSVDQEAISFEKVGLPWKAIAKGEEK
jgi:hypothetical protein